MNAPTFDDGVSQSGSPDRQPTGGAASAKIPGLSLSEIAARWPGWPVRFVSPSATDESVYGE